MQFIHCVNGDRLKTAEITKRWHYQPSHRLNVSVLNVAHWVPTRLGRFTIDLQNRCLRCTLWIMFLSHPL